MHTLKHSADHRPAGPATTLLWRRHPPTLTIIMLSAMFLSSLITDHCTVLNVFLWHQTNNNYPVTMFMMSICDVSKHQKVQTTQEKLSCNTSRPCHGPWAAVHHALDLHNNKLYWLNFQLHNFYEWMKCSWNGMKHYWDTGLILRNAIKMKSYHCSFSCNTHTQASTTHLFHHLEHHTTLINAAMSHKNWINTHFMSR